MFMYLQPGEVFQHTHTESTITRLVEGDVDLEMSGSRTSLVVDKPTPVDANLPHTMYNVGSIKATIECMHQLPTITVAGA